jgi:formate/nitrite transporter FocA (FNT family)
MAKTQHRRKAQNIAARQKPATRKSESESHQITPSEVEDIEERSSPRTPVIYEVVRRLGEEEMARPVVSLWWSGVAAGLSISFSVLAQAILQTRLPDASWRPLVADFGYSVGFVMVVLSRQQLFTENTVTAVLPVMADFTGRNLARMARMWSVVLLANFAGTFFAALFSTYTPTLSPDLYNGMLEVSRHISGHTFAEMFFRGIAAGFLIAAMVWLIPSAEAAQFYVVVLMTYLISAGSFAHIVAGSVEAFLLVFAGQMSWLSMLTGFVIPVLAGNIIGGTALFALIAYAQVMKEI